MAEIGIEQTSSDGDASQAAANQPCLDCGGTGTCAPCHGTGTYTFESGNTRRCRACLWRTGKCRGCRATGKETPGRKPWRNKQQT
jgi:hypothetical protein